LSHHHLTDSDAEELACCRRIGGLACLRLNFNCITDGGALALADSPYLRRIGGLEVMGNLIWNHGRAALTKRFGDRVRFLCARDKDHLYPIQTSPGHSWETGLAGDYQLLMLGEHRRVLAFFFDQEGEFLEQRSRPWPREALGYRGEFDLLWEAT